MAISVTAEEAVSQLRAHEVIGMGLGLGNPPRFLAALNTRTDWEQLTLGATLLVSSADVLLQPTVAMRSGFSAPLSASTPDSAQKSPLFRRVFVSLPSHSVE